jgi:hypothetical protein
MVIDGEHDDSAALIFIVAQLSHDENALSSSGEGRWYGPARSVAGHSSEDAPCETLRPAAHESGSFELAPRFSQTAYPWSPPGPFLPPSIGGFVQ